MKRLTAEWLRKAEMDFLAASILADRIPPLHEAVCFHCQQSAENYLTAMLKEADERVPRIHDLITLFSLLTPHYRLRGLTRGLEFLSQFTLQICYPGESASKRQALAALRSAANVRDACRALLKA